MALIGFARVSTHEQDLTYQINALKKAGCLKIFQGKNSGKKESNQERLKELLSYIREGDIVVVTKLDRLGRSLSQSLRVLDYFNENKIGFKVLNQGIDTTQKNDPMTIAYIQLLGMFAELERNHIIERTREGKQAKINAGNLKAIGGRPKKLTEEEEKKLYKDIKKGISINNAAKKYNISRATVSRYKKTIKSTK